MPAELSSEHRGWSWLWGRVRAHAWFKVCITVVLGVGFGVGYVTVQRFPIVTPRAFSLTGLDRAVAFEPGWIWVYESLVLIVNGVLWLCDDRSAIRRYAWSVAITSALCFVAFLVWPVSGPRPDVDVGPGLYSLVVMIDSPLNSFPSLHAGLLALAAMCAVRTLRTEQGAPVWWLWVPGSALSVLILLATLFTKQHYAVDLVAGVGVAWGAGRWVWQGWEPTERDGRAFGSGR